MKLVKLSLVAAMAAGSFSVLDAKPLEEAIRGVDLSGTLRYRYEEATYHGDQYANSDLQGYISPTNAPHKFRAFIDPKIHIGDGFTIGGQLMYNNDKNGGWADSTKNPNTENPNGVAQTRNEIVLKQAYLQYRAGDANIILGRQQLGTIWTADFTGTAAKALITPAPGITVAGFVVDSFEGNTYDSDALQLDGVAAYRNTGVSYGNNLYGAAFLGDFGPAKLQVWAAHWDRIATLYAADFKFIANLGDRDNIGVKVTYLGNNMTNKMVTQASIDNGNLVDGRVNFKFGGFDARVGGIFFGKKDATTVNTMEDITGPDLLIGKEMFYKGSTWIVASYGQSLFGYIGAGYTLPADVRLGLQLVGGQNVSNDGTAGAADQTKTKYEGVFEASWKVNRNFTLSGYYSYLAQTTEITGASDANDNKQAVRLEALYKF